MKISRKQFLQSTIALAGAAAGGATVVACASRGPTAPPGQVSACGAQLSVVAGHTHELEVPAADVNEKMGGVYRTSVVAGHSHTVSFKPEHFEQLITSGRLNVSTSTDNGHAHGVAIMCS